MHMHGPVTLGHRLKASAILGIGTAVYVYAANRNRESEAPKMAATAVEQARHSGPNGATRTDRAFRKMAAAGDRVQQTSRDNFAGSVAATAVIGAAAITKFAAPHSHKAHGAMLGAVVAAGAASFALGIRDDRAFDAFTDAHKAATKPVKQLPPGQNPTQQHQSLVDTLATMRDGAPAG